METDREITSLEQELNAVHGSIVRSILMRALHDALLDCYNHQSPPCTFREYTRLLGRQHHAQLHAVLHEVMGHARVVESLLFNDYEDVESFAKFFLLDAMPQFNVASLSSPDIPPKCDMPVFCLAV